MLWSTLDLRRAVLLALAPCILTLGCGNGLDLSLEHKRCSDLGQCLPGYICNADNACVPPTVLLPSLPSLPSKSADRVFVASFHQDADAGICSPGLELCDGSCTNTATDIQSCGACGHRCPQPANGVGICHSGMCTIACEANHFVCGSECSPPIEAGHCGPCGDKCPTPANGSATCTDGLCRTICNDGYSECAGQCLNLVSDPLHCGSCATRCDAPPNGNATCAAGKCGVSCAPGLMRCGDSCVDLSKDASDCGGCGKVCAAPAAGTATCNAGKCVTSCLTGFSACEDHCVDITTDVVNCGQCDKHCRMHQSCILGFCFVGE
jgi:Stigma-specific protein, Stig1